LGGANPFAGSATTFGRALSVVSSATSGTVAPSPASVALVGPFLQATNSTLTITGDVIGVFNGATVTSSTHSPFVDLNNTSLSAGTASTFGTILNVGGTGGTSAPATVSLKGPLLSASNSPLTLTNGLVNVANGGVVTMADSTSPLVSITGEDHSLAANRG